LIKERPAIDQELNNLNKLFIAYFKEYVDAGDMKRKHIHKIKIFGHVIFIWTPFGHEKRPLRARWLPPSSFEILGGPS
jgi:hypothetical protein